jgi:hypothetical protein
LTKELVALADDVGAVTDRAVPGRADQGFQRALASLERRARQILSVEVEEIEDEVDKLPLSSRREDVLQRLKAGRSVWKEHRDLTVHNGAPCR